MSSHITSLFSKATQQIRSIDPKDPASVFFAATCVLAAAGYATLLIRPGIGGAMIAASNVGYIPLLYKAYTHYMYPQTVPVISAAHQRPTPKF